MSCIRFSTPAQRAQIAAMSPAMLTQEQADALHPAPDFGPSKQARLRALAGDRSAKIREAAALNLHLPADLQLTLARDTDAGVRGCVARNAVTGADILGMLAADESDVVRGFVALNPRTPGDAMRLLADDPSEVIRGLVSWRTESAAV